jgi:hypothetical protein
MTGMGSIFLVLAVVLALCEALGLSGIPHLDAWTRVCLGLGLLIRCQPLWAWGLR